MGERSTVRAGAPVFPALAAAGSLLVISVAWVLSNDDRSQDLGTGFVRLPWLAIGAALVLPVIAAVHYICAAIAVQRVADPPLPLWRTTLVQLSAAAINRVIP